MHRLLAAVALSSCLALPLAAAHAQSPAEARAEAALAQLSARYQQIWATLTPAQRQALEAEIMAVVDRQIGAVGRPARVLFVGLLPKTRSGKLLRRAVQAVCEGRDPGDLTTMEDPAALQQIKDLVTPA